MSIVIGYGKEGKNKYLAKQTPKKIQVSFFPCVGAEVQGDGVASVTRVDRDNGPYCRPGS